ncbi:hypothetical protein Lepto7375DRAFT_7416 [Leptolyngbya sp. PCC 7375]|nr:hypothetical protein Lepto7375DRAFT_7416 [Leptolyngbya sp. PCC 7375]
MNKPKLPEDLENASKRGDVDTTASLLQHYNPFWSWSTCYQAARGLCGELNQ